MSSVVFQLKITESSRCICIQDSAWTHLNVTFMLLYEFHNNTKTHRCVFIHYDITCFPAFDWFLFGFCLFETSVYFSNLLLLPWSPSSFITAWEAQACISCGFRRKTSHIQYINKQKVLNKSDFSYIWPVSYEFENELKFSSRQTVHITTCKRSWKNSSEKRKQVVLPQLSIQDH